MPKPRMLTRRIPRIQRQKRTTKIKPDPRFGSDRRLIVSKNAFPPTARTFQEYVKDFELDLAALKGKKVLDVGSGYSNFALGANMNGIHAIALDSKESLYNQQQFGVAPFTFKGKSIAREGSFFALPFKAASFDFLVSNQAIFHCANSYSAAIAIKECLRVLKKGGEMRFHVPKVFRDDSSHGISSYSPIFVSWLKRNGFEIKFFPPVFSIEKHRTLFVSIRNTGDLRRLESEI